MKSELQGRIGRCLRLATSIAQMQSRMTQTDAVYEFDPARADQRLVQISLQHELEAVRGSA
jgi:two-component sensor histidine kinase